MTTFPIAQIRHGSRPPQPYGGTNDCFEST